MYNYTPESSVSGKNLMFDGPVPGKLVGVGARGAKCSEIACRWRAQRMLRSRNMGVAARHPARAVATLRSDALAGVFSGTMGGHSTNVSRPPPQDHTFSASFATPTVFYLTRPRAKPIH